MRKVRALVCDALVILDSPCSIVVPIRLIGSISTLPQTHTRPPPTTGRVAIVGTYAREENEYEQLDTSIFGDMPFGVNHTHWVH